MIINCKDYALLHKKLVIPYLTLSFSNVASGQVTFLLFITSVNILQLYNSIYIIILF